MSADTDYQPPPHITNHYQSDGGISKAIYLVFAFLLLAIMMLGVALTIGYQVPYISSLSVSAPRSVAVDPRLGIDPIPTSSYSDVVQYQIQKLQASSCDFDAMLALGRSLASEGQERVAAKGYLRFARRCNNDESATREAAILFYRTGEFKSSRDLFSDLVSRFPQNDLDWYHKGQSEAKLGLNDAALDSYKATISLTRDQKSLGDWVFEEMASIYASEGRFCEAATSIKSYVLMEPASRDNERTRHILSAYQNKGECASVPAPTIEPSNQPDAADHKSIRGTGKWMLASPTNNDRLPGDALATTGMGQIASDSVRPRDFQAAIGHKGYGRCHMDYCSYFIIDSATSVGDGRDGTLFKVEERRWGAEFKRPDNATDSYDEYAHRPTSIDKQERQTMFVYCSKTRPTTFYKAEGDGRWSSQRLRPGDKGAIFGYNESEYLWYFAACHNAIVKDPYNDRGLAERLGYRFAQSENPPEDSSGNIAPRDMLH